MSALWIKICGMTTPEAVEAALAANVDAIGFVFAHSVRRVTPEQAARLAAPARGRVKVVAVTRHPSQVEVDEVVATFKPDLFQTDASDLQSLRLPSQLATLPVLRGAPTGSLPPRVLFEGATSGSGVPCDWTAAQSVARRTELILAGGLNCDNVTAAIAEVAPFGVDVSSGVEERPGVKSPAAIARFVAAARGVSLDPTRLDCAAPMSLAQPVPTRR
ncbi:MAG TPA: phosphoribosylanthranilate isomerase [Steroidobacteraceae bacterium]|jgi:phosphoribosylanthranilate isomerase